MTILKTVLLLLLYTGSSSLFSQYDCIFFPILQHAEINQPQIDSIQIISVKQKVKFERDGTTMWISLYSKSPITASEIDSTLNRIETEYHGDNAVFINDKEHWKTLTPSGNFDLIDSTFYLKFTPKSCWGGAYPVTSKNKIKRNKSNAVTRVKSAEYICDYSYDSNNHIISANIKYRRGVQVYEGAIKKATFIYDATGKISAISTKYYHTDSEADYFTITYF